MMDEHNTPQHPPIQTLLRFALATPEAWAAAHFVPLLPGSKKPDGPWRNLHPDYAAIQQHVAAGGNAGIVPASVVINQIPLGVLDQDAGAVAAMLSAYPPLACAPSSTPDRHHLYYWTTSARGNGTWRGPGGCCGEVRSAAGYVVQHGDEMHIVDQCLAGGLRVDIGWLPDHLIVGGGRQLDADVDTDAGRALAQAWRLWDTVVGTVRRVDIGAGPGQRHVTLVRRTTSWAGRRTWNKAPVTPEFIARRCAAYWLGFPERETFEEDEAVGVLSWALATRERMQSQPHSPAFLAKQATVGRIGGVASGVARRTGTADRDAAIAAAVASGQSRRAVAREHGISDGAVRLILSRDRGLFRGA